MTESELYKSLGALTKDKERWEENILLVASLLTSDSTRILAKALWMLGEMGLAFPESVKEHIPAVAARLAFIWASENIATNTPDPYKEHIAVYAELLHDSDDKVRMEAPEIFRVLGKRRPDFVKPYLEDLRDMAESDPNRVVRIHCQGAIKAATAEK